MKYFFLGRIMRLVAVVCLLLPLSCSSGRKISEVRKQSLSASISLPVEGGGNLPSVNMDSDTAADTVTVTSPDGEEVFIMNAVREEDGEMVATSRLQAAVVTARFRNVAERHGKVTIEFIITVPEHMQDTRWQLRFTPSLVVPGDSTTLESLIVTGEDYRKKQLRGYQQYERFVSKIVTDSTSFIDLRSLELFLMRNIPQIYAFRTDSTIVSDAQFESVFGVDENEALEHYTDHQAILGNLRRIGMKGKMFGRYVKAPILSDGIRLDTVLRTGAGDFRYCYSQEIATRPKLRKAMIYLSGDILEEGEVSYSMPQTDPITFYISSLSAFVDDSPHYIDRITERRAEANTSCYIDFAQGETKIVESLGHNRDEIGRIKGNLDQLVADEKFDIDSIVISSYASPEGSVKSNGILSLSRARSTSEYFESYVKSLRADEGFAIDVSGIANPAVSNSDILFVARSKGENWQMLDQLVSADTLLSSVQKQAYHSLASIDGPDRREQELRRFDFYPYLRAVLYPRLRIVKFDFYLHRKGMVKDTLHTTVIDEEYARGVQAIKDRDYEAAVKLLSKYHDYNLAVAYCAADRNASAMEILSGLPDLPQVLYMKAVIYSRQQNVKKAVQCYLDACRLEPSFVHRGNLDPEISLLIRSYHLNEE